MSITGQRQVVVPMAEAESELGLNHQKNERLGVEMVKLILAPKKLRVQGVMLVFLICVQVA